MNNLKSLWTRLVSWFEYGDLVPLIVIISGVHYADMLAGYDHWFVAIAIGLLVDLGHFRTVRAAVRYGGSDNQQKIIRWLMALAMSAVAITYQQRYYDDWWLSAPLPFLIAALAWLQRVDGIATKSQAATHSETKAKPKPDKAEAVPLPAKPEPKKAKPVLFGCELCGQEFQSQNALNAHARYHKRASKNGHKASEGAIHRNGHGVEIVG